MPSPLFITALQTTSISATLLTAGGIGTLSLFDVPIIRAQPASRALPATRWLFSRGSHVVPPTLVATGAAFLYLAYAAAAGTAPSEGGALLLSTTTTSRSASLLLLLLTTAPARYAAAAACNWAIALWTMRVMVPAVNFALIRKNADKGGVRSAAAARATANRESPGGARSAEDSVAGVGEGVGEWSDTSGPQEVTPLPSSAEEDAEVRALLDRFAWMNGVRAVLGMAGGVIALATALSE